MSINELFDCIPSLLNLYVPGYVLLATYGYLADTKDRNFETTTIGSIVLSYIINLIVSIAFSFITVRFATTTLSVLLAFVFAIIAVKARQSSFFKDKVKKIGHTTGNENIWHDFIDRKNGTQIRCFAKYNNQNVRIGGAVKYYDPCDGGSCNIVLSNYCIFYDNGNVYESKGTQLVFNTNDVYGIEARPE